MTTDITILTHKLRGATTPKGKRMIATKLVNAYIEANEDPEVRAQLLDASTRRSSNRYNGWKHDNYKVRN